MPRKPGHRSSRKLSARTLLGALPVVVLALAAFMVTLQVSVAGVFRSRIPPLALEFMPADAEARARLAGALASNNPIPQARAAARALAHDAIRRDPLNPIALRALGLARATAVTSPGEEAQAAAFFKAAERLSRRDQMTQLWLAELALRHGDIPSLMQHFDVALRTSSSDQETLFPLLAAASADKRVSDALIDRMRKKPGWAQPFATYLLDARIPPETAAYIYRNTLSPKIPEQMTLIQSMMQHLAAAGNFGLARRLYDDFHLGTQKAGANFVNDGGFESPKSVPPFAWSLVEQTDFWAAPQPRQGGGRYLILSATGGRAGDLARQLLQLGPGSYRLSATAGNVPTTGYQRPTITLRCADGDKAVLITARPSAAGPEAQAIAGNFSVPGRCEFQWIAISLSGADTAPTDLPWIDDVTITRTGG